MVLVVRHLMNGISMKIEEKQRSIIGNPIPESRGQPIKISRCWAQIWQWQSDEFPGL